MRVALLLLSLAACGPENPAAKTDMTPDDGALDQDGDGLCDWREESLGTDPLSSDTDGDGLPDLLEFLHNFSPLDSRSPTSQQRIELKNGDPKPTSIEVRFTVVGAGESYRGAFIPMPSALTTGYDSADLYVRGTALGAQPLDNVRDIQDNAQRFVTVTGSTRLSFRLTLGADGLDYDPCVLAHPFAYGLYDDDGRELMRSNYLAIVSSPDQDATFCVVPECI